MGGCVVDEQFLLASVIIPVYNKSKFLDNCLQSLKSQIMDHSRFEAIFIDDGSTDDSLKLLRDYENRFSWVKVIAQENGGVCVARNVGIDHAMGKYIFYLDPDDSISSNTLSDVTAFYENHYDEVDLVTYPIVPYEHGEKKTTHFRFDILEQTGIYDLTRVDNWQICQTTMNICVKNLFEDNIKFVFKTDNGVIFHEDQLYITQTLSKKWKIGFCSTPEYSWNKNSASVSANIAKPLFIFESTIRLYEYLYGNYDGYPPRYLQGLFANDIGWKMRSNSLLPVHLVGEELDDAMARFRALLERTEDYVLMRHPNIHRYHSFFFIKMKHNPDVELKADEIGMSLSRAGSFIHAEQSIECFIGRTRIANGRLLVFGTLKSPFFAFSEEKPRLFANAVVQGVSVEEALPLSESSLSRCGSHFKTATFYNFRYEIPLDRVLSVSFSVEFLGNRYPTYISRQQNRCNFSKALGNVAECCGMYVHLDQRRNRIVVGGSEVVEAGSGDDLPLSVRITRQVMKRFSARNKAEGKEVWLYCDAKGRIDNGWLQFKHDSQYDDGVKRYYVRNGVEVDASGLGPAAKVISFGSKEHKILFVVADKIMVSDVAKDCYHPWGPTSALYYSDLSNAEIVYLQHGVLWAHMPWYYSFDRTPCDREVVSTEFEIDNLVANYCFEKRDLIPAGMPRYDGIETGAAPKRKILICPSWRQYLIGDFKNGSRTPLFDKFYASTYYKGIADLLSNPVLLGLLRAHDYELDFKLHPNFACYKKCFDSCSNDVIHIRTDSITDSEYAIVITDYSSYSFDFVYLNRPLIYFIPDEKLFYGGINHYNRLDLPLEDAFGEYAHSAPEVIDAISRLLENGASVLPQFQEKYRSLFLYRDNKNCERIYRALKQND